MGGLVSGISDLFGGGGNNAGTVAQSANLIQPVTQDQTNAAILAANNGLNSAQGLASSFLPGVTQGLKTQSGLTTALQNEANGIGPNPALDQLNQATGNNISSQASLAAGQRGAGSNVGLIARQIGQQGAGIQQNAAGQAAILQAQQRLAAQNALEGLSGNQVSQGLAGQGAANQVAQQNQQTLLNALQGYNTNQVQNVASQNSANASIANNNANNSAGAIGGLINGASGFVQNNIAPAIGSLFAEGGEVSDAKSLLAEALQKKQFPAHLEAMAKIYHPNAVKMAYGGLAKGAVVPGKPKVDHNSVQNDVVPAMLTPKEIVLPLSVTQSANPGEAAKAFVEKIQKKDDFKEALKAHVKNRKSKK